MSRIAVVAIGRNEGERLRACLTSATRNASAVVYVDSGSTDGSIALAEQLGVAVVQLDLSLPFTAARARNAGFAHLNQLEPDVDYVQFVDGDCEIADGWLARAAAALDADEGLAVAAGRRRERFPDRTVYNRLCDIEWSTPVGETDACGGDAMIRTSAFREAGGYNPAVIAGEEPEMCVRLRAAGWRIVRLDADMTLHDAAMEKFGQWWKRTVRAGHAYAEGAALHGQPPVSHWVRESRSIWLWGFWLPLAALGLAWPTGGLSILLLGGYLLLAARILAYCRRRLFAARDALLYTVFTILGKFPQMLGQVKYHWSRMTGRQSRLIEYKGQLP